MQPQKPIAKVEGSRAIARFNRKPSPPWIVKLSPDMSSAEMRYTAIASTAYEEAVALEGFNTTVSDIIRGQYGITEAGGISGDPLRIRAHGKLQELCRIIQEDGLDIDVIGVGGITHAGDAADRLRAGPRVKMVGSLSGLLNRGFGLIPDILKAIAA
ncbi:MAG: hypothetical protein A3J10_03695 [Candidatus Sungbacteria bacterium RIFCSPLOWO2_02_FULL_54_10]|uniref:Dihydroorotate dehydrogenase catalytic domain-containing protein n=2 Tax=Candidatus Sungiibacteriota TaxID=1817917 RepID=A0A1G2L9I6_9BACT|nr:MAG: hypothetical protein A2679_01825 [Candidatus Sungbacteria bacterium RIFCSPHIGHO2_01_FULL_54_26]OHA02761.1 MAG: hypothetical protein A3C92_00700 [Candidatus Sungbacteria bacterium RIFCSPHIGHO2_02_FULL_53_17]OHA08214.1 MAG: hypothetical protein A3B34_03350 [Candidatus Sungbacteria bacterium RIFCSPLOWO2_01_FULL_54_21]OHA12590.1 MAG: hypothetical protein A3J10_03695 [Candidatus Sungbacteria bacterium RIFCSPLOWO2_02_FULL_54_10]